VFVLPAEASEPEFGELFRYWSGKRREGLLPGRRDIDPLELPRHLLPRVVLLDVIREAGACRFRFRLAGTGYVEVLGRDPTGVFYEEIAPSAQAQLVIGVMQRIVDTREPVFFTGPLTLPRKEYSMVKRLGLPLAQDGRTVDMILALVVPIPRGHP
jgi:hypothetical protein